MKKVIITGGNSGGYQAAKQLAEKGWSVTSILSAKKQLGKPVRKSANRQEIRSKIISWRLSDNKVSGER